MVSRSKFTRILSGAGAMLLLVLVSIQALPQGKASAAALTNISLTLQQGTTPSDVNADGINDGGTMPSVNPDGAGNLTNNASANYAFNFAPSATPVDTVVFKFCTTEIYSLTDTCTAPAGMLAYDATNNPNFTLGNDNGGQGWTVDTADSTANQVVLTVGTAVDLQDAAATPANSANFRLDNMANPYAANTTFYAYIETEVGGYGTAAVDSGSTAASTANPIVLNGKMPESLQFCTGHYLNITGSGTGVPDCTSAKNEVINFNQLFDPNETAWAYSQMAAATNATSGYVITVSGPTMSNGTDTINAIGATPTVSTVGTRQFGMNLVDDYSPWTMEDNGTTAMLTDPTIGNGSLDPITYYNGDGCVDASSNPCGGRIWPQSGDALGNYFGVQASYGYDGRKAGDTTGIPFYKYTSGDVVARSDYTTSGGYVHGSGSPVPTSAQRYTTTYIVNVSGNLPAGTYSTTLTYVCTPTF